MYRWRLETYTKYKRLVSKFERFVSAGEANVSAERHGMLLLFEKNMPIV